MRKLLTFTNEAGERVRILWTDGVCRNPDALAKTANGIWSWDGIRTSGEAWEPKPKMKFIPKKMDPNNPEFLGIQNPPKAQPKPVETDAEGKAIPKRTRNTSGSNPTLLADMTKLAEEGKTLKEAAQSLGVSYPTLYVLAKKEKIAFKAGKKGRQKKVQVTVVDIRPATEDSKPGIAGETMAV